MTEIISQGKIQDYQPWHVVGAAGFEPTITGSKPDALPLGYAPKYTGVLVISAGSISSILEMQCVFTPKKQ